MVLTFTPRGNATDVCAGVDAYVDLRPPYSEQLSSANLALFCILISLEVCTLLWLWLWRDKPLFRKVRPFGLSAMLILGLMVYHVPSFLSPVVSLPCAVPVVCYTISLSWFAAHVMIRSLALTVETQYAAVAKRETNLFMDGDSHFSQPSSVSHSARTVLFNIVFLLKVTLGVSRIDELTIVDLLVTKNSYYLLCAVFTIPAALLCVILIAAVPPFQTCFDCDVFLELPIGFTTVLVFYIIAAFRAVQVAYFHAGWDAKGIIFELFGVPLVVGPIAGLIWILIIVDPGNVAFKRTFNWSSLFSISSLAYWVNCFGYPLYRQYRDRKKQKKLEIGDMKQAFKAQPALKTEFEEFASKHYVSESLQFLEDIATFKEFYYQKGESWRASKFKTLVEAYVLSGAKMEINISSHMKGKLLKTYELQRSKHSQSSDLFTCFDEATHEVEKMIHDGVWTEFLMKRSKRGAVLPSTATSVGGSVSAVVASQQD